MHLKNMLGDIQADENYLRHWVNFLVLESFDTATLPQGWRRRRPHGVIAGAVPSRADHDLGGWPFPDKMKFGLSTGRRA